MDAEREFRTDESPSARPASCSDFGRLLEAATAGGSPRRTEPLDEVPAKARGHIGSGRAHREDFLCGHMGGRGRSGTAI